MKKILFSLAAVMILLSGCDGVNSDIDDLPRTLRISARTITDTLNSDGEASSWSLTEEGFLNVSSADGTYSEAIGNIAITAPRNSYVRSSVDSASASSNDGNYEFAYWLLPSRTDIDRDSESTEGNIRFSTGGPDSISLRTDYEESEIVAAYAKDSSPFFNFPLTLVDNYINSNTIEFSFVMEPQAADTTIYDPIYRIFDDKGEARTEWLNFYDTFSFDSEGKKISDNKEVLIPFNIVPELTFRKSISGIINSGVLDSWKVIIIYKDAVGDVYVVK